MNVLFRNVHLVFLVVKYIILFTAGWFVNGVVSGAFFVIIGSVLFILFDLAAAALWTLLRPQKHVVTIWMITSFYILQVLALLTLLISVFSPSIIAEPFQSIVDLIF